MGREGLIVIVIVREVEDGGGGGWARKERGSQAIITS